MKQRSEQYGPVYKEAIGPFCSVIISDLEEYAKVIAVDGPYPNRTELEPYAHYLRKRGMVIGIVNRSFYLYLLGIIFFITIHCHRDYRVAQKTGPANILKTP